MGAFWQRLQRVAWGAEAVAEPSLAGEPGSRYVERGDKADAGGACADLAEHTCEPGAIEHTRIDGSNADIKAVTTSRPKAQIHYTAGRLHIAEANKREGKARESLRFRSQ